MCWISGRDGGDRFLVVVGLEGVFILCLLGGGGVIIERGGGE